MDSKVCDPVVLPPADRLVRRRRPVPAPAAPAHQAISMQPLPRWVGHSGADVVEPARAALLTADARAGAALFALDLIIRADPPWLGAVRMRLALQAALACARPLRLAADEGGLRDAEHLTRAGDDPGPAGRLYRLWRRLASRPTRLAQDAIDALAVEIGAEDRPAVGDRGHEVLALMRADVEMAGALGWETPIVLAATVIADPCWRGGRERRPFRVGGEGWDMQRMAVFGLAAERAHALAVQVARRAAAASAAAASLRTRDGGAGLALVLSDDCVAPWRMVDRGRAGLGSDRAARRFCESLHAAGALRLLTPRATFRLYGL